MIGDLFFILKSLFLTCVVILLLQIKLGDFTLEEHSMSWLRESHAASFLQEVSHGGVLVIKRTYGAIVSQFETKWDQALDREKIPGYRQLKLKAKRSAEFMEEQAKRLQEEKNSPREKQGQ